MKKLFENWKKYLNESEVAKVADLYDELADAKRKEAEKEAEEQEEEEEREKEQEDQLKLMKTANPDLGSGS